MLARNGSCRSFLDSIRGSAADGHRRARPRAARRRDSAGARWAENSRHRRTCADPGTRRLRAGGTAAVGARRIGAGRAAARGPADRPAGLLCRAWRRQSDRQAEHRPAGRPAQPRRVPGTDRGAVQRRGDWRPRSGCRAACTPGSAAPRASATRRPCCCAARWRRRHRRRWQPASGGPSATRPRSPAQPNGRRRSPAATPKRTSECATGTRPPPTRPRRFRPNTTALLVAPRS